MVDPINQTCFRFIEIFAMGLGINGIVGLAIGGAILIEADVFISFYGLSL